MAQDIQPKKYLDYNGLIYYTQKILGLFGVLSITEIDQIIAHAEDGGCVDCNPNIENTEENN